MNGRTLVVDTYFKDYKSGENALIKVKNLEKLISNKNGKMGNRTKVNKIVIIRLIYKWKWKYVCHSLKIYANKYYFAIIKKYNFVKALNDISLEFQQSDFINKKTHASNHHNFIPFIKNCC